MIYIYMYIYVHCPTYGGTGSVVEKYCGELAFTSLLFFYTPTPSTQRTHTDARVQ